MNSVISRNARKRTICVGLLATGLLSGCNLAPAYKRPAQPVQNSWPQDAGMVSPTSSSAAATLGWKNFFVDRRLKTLIELAMKNNRDLRGQAAAIIEAQGQYQVQHASLFPSISTTGSGMYVAPSSTGGFSFAPGQGEGVSTLRYYSLGIGFSSYEIDLFGRIRNLSKQEAEAALASEYNARSVLISTVSQIATTYIQWLADRELLQLASDTLTSQSETLRLTRMQYDHGESDLLTVSQINTQVEQAGSDREQARRQIAQDEHELQLLVGAPLPNDLPPAASFGQQTVLTDLPAGLPSDLIANRPDIQSAEHTLIGANANIGAARAAFFPRVTLTATEGISSLEFRRLFTPGAEMWALSPSISLPIFTWGQNEGNLRISKARKLQEIATYEKTVQTAFKEVSDALSARETYLAQGRRMTGLVASSQRAYDLSMMRFNTGSISYLTALVQQRNLYQAQRSLIEVEAARYQNMVTLYRALGGGWSQSAKAG
ncbi:efflux transporter outer membrane subunit [Acetobacter persici]|uniref:efflux transporter outer membrane subunit n=1 Tax=Acetobacter persici TaxID=1076596 RepID=UPI0020CEEA4C|nr:efflux transporter outer membrane subunit [Acetobacter persici]MCP9320623.1 efflux transporter outer membrane subunit [Acetobacter persici]